MFDLYSGTGTIAQLAASAAAYRCGDRGRRGKAARENAALAALITAVLLPGEGSG